MSPTRWTGVSQGSRTLREPCLGLKEKPLISTQPVAHQPKSHPSSARNWPPRDLESQEPDKSAAQGCSKKHVRAMGSVRGSGIAILKGRAVDPFQSRCRLAVVGDVIMFSPLASWLGLIFFNQETRG